ncbi:MAG: hypothetical protein M3Z04_23960 [Chloroflexota bacterium]|nr:hypothetical protein [Chloroflexota bacterium]
MSMDQGDEAQAAHEEPSEEIDAVPFRRPPNRRRWQMRYTIIDASGSVSFIGPCQGLKPLVAACATGAQTAEAVLTVAGEYDNDLRERVLAGLHVFDEHNVPGDYSAIHSALAGPGDGERPGPILRVVDAPTRHASLTPHGAGLILFNLPQQRIVQVQNTYGPIERSDRGRVRRNGRATGHTFRYRLPPGWAILP